MLTTPHASKHLRLQWQGFPRATGPRTWGSRVTGTGNRQLRGTAVPGRYGSGRFRHLLSPGMGNVLEFGPVSAEPETRVQTSGIVPVHHDDHPGLRSPLTAPTTEVAARGCQAGSGRSRGGRR